MRGFDALLKGGILGLVQSGGRLNIVLGLQHLLPGAVVGCPCALGLQEEGITSKKAA